jgi:large subunit ribosomal protein L18
LAIYRSTNHIYAQIIDDELGQTMVSASTAEKDLRGSTGGNIEAAKRIGRAIAERARAAGIKQVVFDRGGYLYHGRIKALTDAAREAGLNPDEAKPAVIETAPAEAEAKPAKGEGKPGKGEGKPAKDEGKPAKGEGKSAKGEAKASKGEGKPARPPKADAKPAKDGSKPETSEMESGAGETVGARSEAIPPESNDAASVQAKEAGTEQE